MLKTLTEVIPSTIKDLFRNENFSPTDVKFVREVCTVIKKIGKNSVSRLPVAKTLLDKMLIKVVIEEKSVRDFFTMLLMFLGVLRASEVVALKRDDVWLEYLEDHGEVI